MGHYWPDLKIGDDCEAFGSSAYLAYEIENKGYREGYCQGFNEARMVLEKLIFRDGLLAHEAFRVFLDLIDRVIAWAHKEKGDVCEPPTRNINPPYEMEPPHPGFIYFLRADNGLYKIGKTKVLDRRIKQLGIKLPYKLELIHAVGTDEMHYIEKDYHRRYAQKRIRGEWFALTDEDIVQIKNTKYIFTGGISEGAP